MRVLLAGGGTGGHIYPALALARCIRKREPRAQLLFVGTEKGLENKVVSQAGFDLETITVRGLPRKLSLEVLKTFAYLTRGGLETHRILKRFRPRVVIGTGGYVSGPVVLWASLLGIPCLVHEQNAIPGMTNKILARYSRHICVSFASSVKYFPGSRPVEVTGNPRASEVVGISRVEGIKYLGLNPNKKNVLVVGGSAGAERINRCMMGLLPRIKKWEDLQLIYITGPHYYPEVTREAEKVGIDKVSHVMIRPYLDDMPLVLSAVDLIVSRAGATTLAEITARGIPAVLIPSPNVTDNHQYHNARALAECGAAVLLPEGQLQGTLLGDIIRELIGDGGRLAEMSKSSSSLGKPDSADMIYGLVEGYLN